VVLIGMRISQKINIHFLYLGYFLFASNNSCRSCLTGGPPNVQNSKICCGFFCTVLFSAVRRQCCDIGYSELVFSKESGTKIWHVMFTHIVKVGPSFPSQVML